MSATENQEIIEFSEPDEAASLEIKNAAGKPIEKPIFFGTSESMQKAKEEVEKVAPTKMSVLITGETGAGKEVIADAIHKSSPRKDKPFKAVNCGVFFNEQLLQSELFGHEKGAFTDATSMRRGVFELANGGTLFLDEVGEMSPEVQVKFLRVLETQTFERLGGEKTINVDVRIIAATNVDLKAAMQEKKFREDIYYRIKQNPIHIPPLRDRREDILHFVKMFVEDSNGKHFTHITEAALSSLKNYDWPGNIRELKNFIERIVLRNTKDLQLQLKHVEEGFKATGINTKDPLPIKDPKIERRKDEILQKIHKTSQSASMQDVWELVEQVAPREVTVLITGETGVGKEVIADAIHDGSPRKDEPFIAVNCGAFHGERLQSGLFGHEEGAFPGAIRMRGVFEQADGGTLFLDNIGDMSPEVQAALLRVLDTQEFARLGGEQNIKVDVRIIAATNVDVEAAVHEKKFREDLYQRLNGVSIHIPPLRERQEDIPHFVEIFVSELSEKHGKSISNIPQEVSDYLQNVDWHGNVRQLKKSIERAIILAKGSQLKLEYFQIKIKEHLPIKDPKIERRKGLQGLFNEILGFLNTWSMREDSPLKSTDTEKPWSLKQLGCLAVYYLYHQPKPAWYGWSWEKLAEACKVKLNTLNTFKREQLKARPPAFRQYLIARIQEAVAPPENSDREENGPPDT